MQAPSGQAEQPLLACAWHVIGPQQLALSRPAANREWCPASYSHRVVDGSDRALVITPKGIKQRSR